VAAPNSENLLGCSGVSGERYLFAIELPTELEDGGGALVKTLYAVILRDSLLTIASWLGTICFKCVGLSEGKGQDERRAHKLSTQITVEQFITTMRKAYSKLFRRAHSKYSGAMFSLENKAPRRYTEVLRNA
jgi:hypothetical protein